MFTYDLRVGDSGASQSVGRSHSHLCWVFDDHADFRAAAVEFLADGLARGLRVDYIAAGDEQSLRADSPRWTARDCAPRRWPERLVAALGLTRVRVEHQGI